MARAPRRSRPSRRTPPRRRTRPGGRTRPSPRQQRVGAQVRNRGTAGAGVRRGGGWHRRGTHAPPHRTRGDPPGRRACDDAAPTQAAPPPITGEGTFVQLLTPEGERVHHPEYDLELTDDDYRALFRDLVLVRRIDAEATALQRQGELGLWASLLGQEAAQVGAGRALRAGDMAFPTYREHGVAWCRGVDPLTLLGLFRGTTNGGWRPDEHGFALYTIVIGDQCPQAVGYAMGIQLDGAEDAVMVFFGDGASSQGDVNESFIWASVFNAPVVFFCQNNQWAISEPLERQTRIPLYQRADGLRLPRRPRRRQRRAGHAWRSPRPCCSGPGRVGARR